MSSNPLGRISIICNQVAYNLYENIDFINKTTELSFNSLKNLF